MPHPMHIAFVADCIEGHGDSVVAGRRFVERLREEHEVTVLSADAAARGQVQLPKLFGSLRRMRDLGFALARPRREQIAKALDQADVVHIQHPFWLSMVAVDEAKRRKLPLVSAFNVQPETVLDTLSLHSQRATDWLYNYWIQHLYNRSDVVVCPSEFAERKLREHGLTVPSVVISHGTHSQATVRHLEARDPQDQGFFLILAVGELSKAKNQAVLLRALRYSKHRHYVKVVVAGQGPQEKALRELAAMLPNKVDIGHVPQDRLDQLLATCDLFVDCAKTELEGMPVVDAMNAGRPVIVAQSDESATSALAIDDRFSFPAGDERALAKKIDALIEQPEVRRAAGEVYQRLARRFPFEESAQKLVTTYRTTIAMYRATARMPRFSLTLA